MGNKRLVVTAAGAIINFSIGILYAWSVLADGLIKELGWSRAEAMLPYTIELFTFSMATMLGGRFQDRFGPRRAVFISGLFSGLSLIICGLSAAPAGVALGFGIGFGASAAFSYSSVTPAVLKWFPPGRRGLATGIVLMSLGVSALVWAPVINYFMARLGVLNTFIAGGILLMVVMMSASLAISVPSGSEAAGVAASKTAAIDESENWRNIVRKPSFRTLWLILGLTSGIGLMFVGQLVQMAEFGFGVSWGYLLVSLFALANALGRLGGGLCCDRFGYAKTMYLSFAVMFISLVLFFGGWNPVFLVAGTAFIGLSYGSLYTVFPAAVAALFGLKNFGVNYGMVFTGLGLIGSLFPFFSAYLAETTGSYNLTYMIGLLTVVICLVLVNKLNRDLKYSF